MIVNQMNCDEEFEKIKVLQDRVRLFNIEVKNLDSSLSLNWIKKMILGLDKNQLRKLKISKILNND